MIGPPSTPVHSATNAVGTPAEPVLTVVKPAASSARRWAREEPRSWKLTSASCQTSAASCSTTPPTASIAPRSVLSALAASMARPSRPGPIGHLTRTR